MLLQHGSLQIDNRYEAWVVADKQSLFQWFIVYFKIRWLHTQTVLNCQFIKWDWHPTRKYRLPREQHCLKNVLEFKENRGLRNCKKTFPKIRRKRYKSVHGCLCVLVWQVRESDEEDPFREKTVQLLDDFKIAGVNGTRILHTIPHG